VGGDHGIPRVKRGLTDVVEEYLSEHSVSFDEFLFQWPFERVERMLEAFQRRRLVERIVEQKQLVVANYHTADFEKSNDRSEAIRSAEMSALEQIANIYDPPPSLEEMAKGDEFLAAGVKQMWRLRHDMAAGVAL
jgi:hypothetical protein